MKKNIFIALVSLTAWGAFAQSPLEKGRWQLNAGLGTSGWGTPVYLGFDYGAHRDITIGIEGSYQSHDYGANYSSTIFGFWAKTKQEDKNNKKGGNFIKIQILSRKHTKKTIKS